MDPRRCSSALPGRTRVAQRMGDARNARELAPDILGATLSEDTAKAIARAESGAQALTLLMASPEFMRR